MSVSPPSLGNIPLPHLCPLPGFVSSPSPPQGQGGQVPTSGCTSGLSTPCPRRGRVTSAQELSTVLGRARCSSPRLRPGRGKEARDAAARSAAALGSPPASPPSAHLENTRPGMRAAGEGSRLCKHLCAAPLAGSRRVLGKRRGQRHCTPCSDPSQPLPAFGVPGTPRCPQDTHLQEAEELDLVVFLFLGGDGDV